jgi:Regulator of chromosome condensation (RCC1) repeat
MSSPIKVEDVVQSNVSYNTGCVMTVRGRVYCWGDNNDNAVGSIYAPPTCPRPYVVPLWNEPYTQPVPTP